MTHTEAAKTWVEIYGVTPWANLSDNAKALIIEEAQQFAAIYGVTHKTPERKLLERILANNGNLGLGYGELDQGELDILRELRNDPQNKEGKTK